MNPMNLPSYMSAMPGYQGGPARPEAMIGTRMQSQPMAVPTAQMPTKPMQIPMDMTGQTKPMMVQDPAENQAAIVGALRSFGRF